MEDPTKQEILTWLLEKAPNVGIPARYTEAAASLERGERGLAIELLHEHVKFERDQKFWEWIRALRA